MAGKPEAPAPPKKSGKKGGFVRWLKRLFPAWSSNKLSRDLKKVKELSEKELSKQSLRKKLFTDHQTSDASKEKKESYVHIKDQELIRKAGLDWDATQFRRWIFYVALIITGVLAVVAIIIGAVYNAGWQGVSVFLGGLLTVGFVAILLLVGGVAATYLDLRITKRRKQVEEVLPDFLQLTAANIGAGMPIDRALWYAVRPRFGVLAAEIETVAKRVLTGEELDDALRNFAQQYESPVLQRSVNLLLEGIAAGGHIADLLHKIAVDIQEQRILREEMAANVMTYVIFISFASVLAAPVLFGLSTELLIVIKSIAAGIGSEASSGAFSVTPDVVSLTDFRIFSLSVLSGSALFSALIVGVIQKGEAKEGLRLVPGFIIVAATIYFLSASFFHGLFGGLV